AVTPAAGNLTPVTAIILGAVGGALAAVGVGLKYRFKFDDSLDVVGVHLVAGLWGTVGIGLLATDDGLLTGGGGDGFKLFIVQVVIAVVALVYTAVVTFLIGMALKKTVGWRISGDDEVAGIDATLHAETAYANDEARELTALEEEQDAAGAPTMG
ncbi:MAG: ammonium transporter, partial [Corynebacterium nuruki]|nr:ammonium transporter [Corynebacterium nuruki]